MGLVNSIEKKVVTNAKKAKVAFVDNAKLQREIQMSINIARARDSLQWCASHCLPSWYHAECACRPAHPPYRLLAHRRRFGGLYTGVFSTVIVAKLAGKAVPPVVAVPGLLGAFALTNMADMACAYAERARPASPNMASRRSRTGEGGLCILDNSPCRPPFCRRHQAAAYRARSRAHHAARARPPAAPEAGALLRSLHRGRDQRVRGSGRGVHVLARFPALGAPGERGGAIRPVRSEERAGLPLGGLVFFGKGTGVVTEMCVRLCVCLCVCVCVCRRGGGIAPPMTAPPPWPWRSLADPPVA